MSTGQQLITSVRAALNDAAGVRWTDAELLGYLNESLSAIVSLVPEANAVEALHTPADNNPLQTLPQGASKFLKVVENEQPPPEIFYEQTYFQVGNWLTSNVTDPVLIDGYKDPMFASLAGAQNEQSQAWIDRDSEPGVERYHFFLRNTATNVHYGFRAGVRLDGEASQEIGTLGSPDPWQSTAFSVVDELGDPDTTSRLNYGTSLVALGGGTGWVASGNGRYVIAPGPLWADPDGQVAVHVCPFGSTTFVRSYPAAFPPGFRYVTGFVTYVTMRGKFYITMLRAATGSTQPNKMFIYSSVNGTDWTLEVEEDAPAGQFFGYFLAGIKEYRQGCLAFATYTENIGAWTDPWSDIHYMDIWGNWLRTRRAYSWKFGRSITLGPRDRFYILADDNVLYYNSMDQDAWSINNSLTFGDFTQGDTVSVTHNPQDPENSIIVSGTNVYSPNEPTVIGYRISEEGLETNSYYFYAAPANYAGTVNTQIITPRLRP